MLQDLNINEIFKDSYLTGYISLDLDKKFKGQAIGNFEESQIQKLLFLHEFSCSSSSEEADIEEPLSPPSLTSEASNIKEENYARTLSKSLFNCPEILIGKQQKIKTNFLQNPT